MHEHGGGGHGGSGLNLLPLWIQVIGVLVMAVITAIHAVHLLGHRGMSRQIGWWHSTHLLMGVGMLYMVAPWSGSPGSTRAWQYIFAIAAAAIVGWAGLRVQRGEAVNALWVPAGIGMGAMAYMFFVHRGHGTPAISYLLVAYYLAEAAGWSRGWFDEADGRRNSAIPYAIGTGPASAVQPLVGRTGRDVSAPAAAMALAMGYMFLAMDFGSSEFFGKAFGAGAITEQSLWAGALIALTVLACTPGRRLPQLDTAHGRPAARRERVPVG